MTPYCVVMQLGVLVLRHNYRMSGVGSMKKIYPVKGFRLGTTKAGIRYSDRKDLVVMEIAEGATVAGVFTKNAFCAAPVQVAKQHLSNVTPRYLVVNTGNANAGNGPQGLVDASLTCQDLAELVNCNEQEVLPFSTGVIGEVLPVDTLIQGLPNALSSLSEDGWADAAEGIMTTDTYPKAVSRQIEYQGEMVAITGIAKGAGMIKPNMATMLAYVATDLAIESDVLQQMLDHAVNQSFNRITVDGDTSTNDACVLIATGQSSASAINEIDADIQQAITEAFVELAQALIRDAEGATKFITIAVKGGATEEECLAVAYTVAESPLVKTALFASDPNWGRVLAAVGRAGVDNLDADQVKIYLDDVLIAENGGRAASYTEEQGQTVMDQEDISITIDLTRGKASTQVWTSDLSHDYIKINAEYRT